MEEAKSYDHRLQLFFAPPLETAIQSIDFVEIRPIGQVVKDGPIEFNIPGNTYHYVDLKHFQFPAAGHNQRHFVKLSLQGLSRCDHVLKY